MLLQFFKIQSKEYFVFEEASSQYHAKENSYFVITCWNVLVCF